MDIHNISSAVILINWHSHEQIRVNYMKLSGILQWASNDGFKFFSPTDRIPSTGPGIHCPKRAGCTFGFSHAAWNHPLYGERYMCFFILGGFLLVI
jgi:hypothetical protein